MRKSRELGIRRRNILPYVYCKAHHVYKQAMTINNPQDVTTLSKLHTCMLRHTDNNSSLLALYLWW